NYFIGGAQAVDLERWHSLTFRNNTMYTVAGTQPSWLMYTSDENPAGYNDGDNSYYGSSQFWVFPNCSNWPCASEQTIGSALWQGMGLDKGSAFSSDAPAGVWTFVRANQYEAGRANIVIYNWDLNPSVSVDLSDSGIKIGD